MAFRGLKIYILILAMMLPGTAFAITGTSPNYKIHVDRTTGAGFKAVSPNHSAIGIIDENFNAYSTEHVLCGSFTSEVWGCRPIAPPPPPPPPDEPEAGGITDIPEEIIIIEPEIPDEPEEETPDHIIFTWDELGPEEEPEVPDEPEQIAFVPPKAIVQEYAAPPRGAALEPTQGAWCEQIACYGAAKVLLRPAAPQITYIQIYPILQYVLALLLIVLAALLILLSLRVGAKRRRPKFTR